MAKVNKWSHKVKSVSTFPPENTFNKDAKTIARVMASKKVSPKGLASGIRMIQFFINRAGKNLSQSRRKELVKARQILSDWLKEQHSTEKRASPSKPRKQ